MRYSYDIVKRFYDLGLFTKENVQEDKSAETTTSTQPTVAPTA